MVGLRQPSMWPERRYQKVPALPDSSALPALAIEATGLTKTYAASKRMPEKQALKGIDLAIPRGSIFGLLGPNGAGKSTFINILAGLVNKTSGSVKIWGIDADQNPRESRAALGVVPQEINMDPFFTPTETLDLMAGFYGVPKAERRGDEILEALGLGIEVGIRRDMQPPVVGGGLRCVADSHLLRQRAFAQCDHLVFLGMERWFDAGCFLVQLQGVGRGDRITDSQLRS